MTKRTLRVQLEEDDWIHQLDGKTIEEAIAHLSNYPSKALLDVDWDYDSKYGEIYVYREETDGEYAARLAQEAEDKRQREEAKRLVQERLDERLIMLKSEDAALAGYLEKHRDNPAIGDLENLFTAVMNLARSGASAAVTGPLLECMANLERNSS